MLGNKRGQMSQGLKIAIFLVITFLFLIGMIIIVQGIISKGFGF